MARGQRKPGAPQNETITFNNNLHKSKSEAAWAGAPSAGILSADCLHRGTIWFGCSHASLGTTADCSQGDTVARNPHPNFTVASPGGDAGRGRSVGFLLHQRGAGAQGAARAEVQLCWPRSPAVQPLGLPGEHTPRPCSATSSTPGLRIPCAPPSPPPEQGGNSQPLLELASAREPSSSAKPAPCHSTIAFPNSTFFAFWVPLTLPEAFPEQRGIHFCKADLLPGELNMFIFSQHVTVSILPVKHPFTVCLV